MLSHGGRGPRGPGSGQRGAAPRRLCGGPLAWHSCPQHCAEQARDGARAACRAACGRGHWGQMDSPSRHTPPPCVLGRRGGWSDRCRPSVPRPQRCLGSSARAHSTRVTRAADGREIRLHVVSAVSRDPGVGTTGLRFKNVPPCLSCFLPPKAVLGEMPLPRQKTLIPARALTVTSVWPLPNFYSQITQKHHCGEF